jgi:hypothetical protein
MQPHNFMTQGGSNLSKLSLAVYEWQQKFFFKKNERLKASASRNIYEHTNTNYKCFHSKWKAHASLQIKKNLHQIANFV